MRLLNQKLYSKIKEILNKITADFGGGCGLDKAYIMAWLIVHFNLKSTADIGVYRGRSLFPQAIAHKNYSKGIVYGIDPWTQNDAMENGNIKLKKQIREFIDKTNFQKIFEEVNNFRIVHKFKKNCTLIRKRSEDAAKEFVKKNVHFDLIHIDGNHDTKIVISDVNNYLPLLNKDGFVILDDISWDSVKPAQKILENKLNLVCLVTDGENDYSIFWKNKSKIKSLILKCLIKYWKY